MVASFQKCERALQAINSITSQHSIETIDENYMQYLRTKESNLKQFLIYPNGTNIIKEQLINMFPNVIIDKDGSHITMIVDFNCTFYLFM